MMNYINVINLLLKTERGDAHEETEKQIIINGNKYKHL